MEYTLTLNDQEIRVLGLALSDLPYKHAFPIIRKLQDQVDQQDAKTEKTVPFPVAVPELPPQEVNEDVKE